MEYASYFKPEYRINEEGNLILWNDISPVLTLRQVANIVAYKRSDLNVNLITQNIKRIGGIDIKKDKLEYFAQNHIISFECFRLYSEENIPKFASQEYKLEMLKKINFEFNVLGFSEESNFSELL